MISDKQVYFKTDANKLLFSYLRFNIKDKSSLKLEIF